jgi:hypothetical protein
MTWRTWLAGTPFAQEWHVPGVRPAVEGGQEAEQAICAGTMWQAVQRRGRSALGQAGTELAPGCGSQPAAAIEVVVGFLAVRGAAGDPLSRRELTRPLRPGGAALRGAEGAWSPRRLALSACRGAWRREGFGAPWCYPIPHAEVQIGSIYEVYA